MLQGKMKAIAFSYDDGVTQDQRLIAMLNHYGMKGNFNLNSGLMGTAGALVNGGVTVAQVRPRACEISRIYRGHEVAAHTLTHPRLTELPDEEVIRQVEEDRLMLSDLVGCEVKGMAYPCGGVNYDQRVVRLLREHTGIRYARTTLSTHSFDLPEDPYCFHATVRQHREWPEMECLAREFLAAPATQPMLLTIWGHAYKFDVRDEWDAFDRFLASIAGQEDVCYCTLSEALGV